MSPLRPWLVTVPPLVALFAGCSNTYRCPTPIGTIVRDDCASYQTKFESLKVELGFSVAGVHFGLKAGQDKLRDPSELLQVLMLETMALCKDYNACRVPALDYRRRREAADHKFTAVVAISHQLKTNLDAENKRRLVQKLIEIIAERPQPSPAAATAANGGASSRGRFSTRRFAFHPGLFRRITSPWFGSRFIPQRPELPDGVPVLATWWIGHGSGLGKSTHINLNFWGKTEADDRVYLSFTTSDKRYDAAVTPQRKKPQGRARVTDNTTHLPATGQMNVDYKQGATGKTHRLGSYSLDPAFWIDRGYLAYHADPVERDPVAYERPWILFYSKVRGNPQIAMRCSHKGVKLGSVINGRSRYNPYRASKLNIHSLPLPVRIPLKGGSERVVWDKPLPGQTPLRDLLPSEAAGKWRCVTKINARKARIFTFTLRADGSVVPTRKPDDGAWPWWPLTTKRVANSVEERAEAAR